MKKFILTLILILLATTCYAKTVTLSWDASQSEGVTSYTIYQGLSDTALNIPIVAGDVLTFVINDLDDAVGYYYGVTASNAAGFESELSNIVYSPAFAPPEPPKALGGTTTVNNVDIPMQ